MRLTYHPDAEAELIDAARYYETRVATLGAQFLVEANRAVGIILESPERWAVLDEDIGRYMMSRFPFGIYYRVSSDRSTSSRSSITADIPITGGTATPPEPTSLQASAILA